MNAIHNPKAKTKWNRNHRKEGKCYFESYGVVDLESPFQFRDAELHTLVELRLYGTGSRNYACIWIHFPNGATTQGSGWAGGCGYHRPSAAADEAIRNSGFTLDKSIHGVGDSAIAEAVMAIARAIGCKRPAFVHAHA